MQAIWQRIRLILIRKTWGKFRHNPRLVQSGCKEQGQDLDTFSFYLQLIAYGLLETYTVPEELRCLRGNGAQSAGRTGNGLSTTPWWFARNWVSRRPSSSPKRRCMDKARDLFCSGTSPAKGRSTPYSSVPRGSGVTWTIVDMTKMSESAASVQVGQAVDFFKMASVMTCTTHPFLGGIHIVLVLLSLFGFSTHSVFHFPPFHLTCSSTFPTCYFGLLVGRFAGWLAAGSVAVGRLVDWLFNGLVDWLVS